MLLLLGSLLLLLLSEPEEELVEKKDAGVVVLMGKLRARAVVEGAARPRADRSACRIVFFLYVLVCNARVLDKASLEASLSDRPTVCRSRGRNSVSAVWDGKMDVVPELKLLARLPLVN